MRVLNDINFAKSLKLKSIGIDYIVKECTLNFLEKKGYIIKPSLCGDLTIISWK